MRLMVRWATYICAALIVIGLAASWSLGSLIVRAEASPAPSFAIDAQSVGLMASDGSRIAGSYLPSRSAGSPAILLLHGNGASRDQFGKTAAWLNALGYGVLAIDFRGHGQSEQRPRSFGLFEARDAGAAFDWLRARHSRRKIGVLGISLGGAAALLGEQGPLAADAMVLQAVYPHIRSAIRNRIAAVGVD